MARKTTDYHSVVIVCEGSDTEFNYFSSVKDYIRANFPDRYTQIKVVPLFSEIIKERNPRRKLRGKLLSGNQENKGGHYWCLWEESKDDYEKFKRQPTRYVREAVLYMEQYGYTNAWVVYDKDVHPDHEFAYEYASSIPNLKIAFSSYCFEEWLLAHFGRFKDAYMHSECKDENDRIIMCGTDPVSLDDCKGLKCLGGKLRHEKYIPNYSKNATDIFEKYTIPLFQKAIINAAWLRHLSNAPIYDRNPYTNVDLMLLDLFGESREIYWCTEDSPLSLPGGIKYSVEIEDEYLKIKNEGKGAIVFSPNNLLWISKQNYENIEKAIPHSIILQPQESFPFSIIPNAFLCYNKGNISIIFAYEKASLIDGLC